MTSDPSPTPNLRNGTLPPLEAAAAAASANFASQQQHNTAATNAAAPTGGNTGAGTGTTTTTGGASAGPTGAHHASDVVATSLAHSVCVQHAFNTTMRMQILIYTNAKLLFPF